MWKLDHKIDALMSNKELAARLPVFFRALRQGEKAGKSISSLKKIIKDTWTS